MDTRDKVVVQSRNGSQLLPMTSIDLSTLQVIWELNSAYQLTFTAIDNGMLDFSMLLNENYIWFENQQYVIKQAPDNYVGNKHERVVTATHVYYQLNNFRKDDVKSGNQKFKLNDIMSWLMKDVSGYSYVIHGTFSSEQMLSDFGNCTIADGISTLAQTYGIYAVYPDNKVIHLYNRDTWIKPTKQRLSYRYNASSVNIQIDTTTFSNRIRVISTHVTDELIEKLQSAIDRRTEEIDKLRQVISTDAAKLSDMRNKKAPKATIDAFNKQLQEKRNQLKKWNEEVKNNRVKLKEEKQKDRRQPLFESFFLDDKDSISKWGILQAEKYETPNEDKTKASESARKKLSPEPPTSITLPNLANNIAIKPGETVILQIPDIGLITEVEAVSVSRTPFKTDGITVTLNNRKKNYLDIWRSTNNKLKQDISTKNQNGSSNNEYRVLEVGEISD
ncbi:prophage endopeptidase tail family protein [Weissella viridescens]|uniref:prophage endopeptidase tail family protein n=1 Tax=Weissella viridescens TaxID=1629 RepID=UPI003AF1F1EB